MNLVHAEVEKNIKNVVDKNKKQVTHSVIAKKPKTQSPILQV